MSGKIHRQIKKTVFCGCLVSFLLTGCEDSNQNTAPTPPEVPVVKISATEIPVTKEYIGITQSTESVGIRARVKGFLIKMNFTEGKPVKKDQLLFMIDPKPFEAKLNMAKGQLAKSIADEQYQEVQYKRMKELIVKGDVSQSRYDEVASQYHEAQAQVEVQRAQVDEAAINLSYCSMQSPFDGIIGVKFVDVGNLVGGGENTLLANVVKLNPIYVEFSPSVNDFAELLKYRANMPFKVEVTLPHEKDMIFHGQIDLVNNQADVSTSTILMRAEIENPEQLLLPGIYVNIKLILTNKGKAMLLPAQAVMETQGQRTVYVVNKDKKVESRMITVAGQYQQQYIIKSGLNEGDLVINNGLQKINPGEQVTTRISNQ